MWSKTALRQSRAMPMFEFEVGYVAGGEVDDWRAEQDWEKLLEELDEFCGVATGLKNRNGGRPSPMRRGRSGTLLSMLDHLLELLELDIEEEEVCKDDLIFEEDLKSILDSVATFSKLVNKSKNEFLAINAECHRVFNAEYEPARLIARTAISSSGLLKESRKAKHAKAKGQLCTSVDVVEALVPACQNALKHQRSYTTSKKPR
ncbi:hypothetical protein BKA65DRAFT_600071 [Rhexocercosporidium sp. MPI-PUGE-AT-0058]|nr:hypothetical protein BKA65DRAFT_600071 [Rhexocercosporidium sp. MPI-PUGE-AT-0058]